MSQDRAPWQEDQVVQVPERPGWVYWVAGLDDAALQDVASAAPGGADDPEVLGAIRALDLDATVTGTAWGVGMWFPADQGGRPRAGFLLSTYPERGDVEKAYRTFVKSARAVPHLPGVTISSYDMAEGGEVDFGRFVEQVIDTAPASGELELRWRYTFFPTAKDEVVVLEFQTAYAHLVDALEDEIVALIENMYYRVPEGWQG